MTKAIIILTIKKYRRGKERLGEVADITGNRKPLEEVNRELLTKTRIILSREYPFLSFLLLKTKIYVIEDKIGPGTAFTDGKDIYVNKDFIFNELKNDKDRIAVILHELLHIAFLHVSRYKKLNKKNTKAWNIATDLKINRLISSNSLFRDSVLNTLNDVVLNINGNHITIKIDDETTEEIYYRILDGVENPSTKTQEKQDRQEKQDGNDGSGKYDPTWKDMNGNYSKIDINEKDLEKFKEFDDIDRFGELSVEEKKEIEQLLEKGTQYAKQIGKLPNHIERIIKEVLTKKVDWKKLLKSSVGRGIKNDYSWKRYHRKTWVINAPLPSVYGEEIKLGVVIDTSFSISPDELGEFLNVLSDLVKQYMNVKLNVAFVDTEVHYEEETNLYQNDINKLKDIFNKVKGGGGTNMVAGMIWAVEKGIKQLAILTDGYTDLEDYNKYRNKLSNLVWVITSNGTDEYLRELKDTKIKISR